MTTDVAKKVVPDEFESQIRTAQATLDTLKTQAETAKANLEIKAIAELLPKGLVIQRKLLELKNSSGDAWDQAKTDLDARIADFERSVQGIASKKATAR